MDAFFVSVEELYDPSLKGKPVVVGGRPNERGVVSAASYAARKFGVHSAMPLRTAYKLCPQAIFVDGHPDRYREYSHRVYDVLRAFSPLVEMASIDEAYLDMTGTERLYGPPLRAAHLLHERVKAAHPAELLHRHCGFAAGGQDLARTRPSPTACCGCMPGRGARVPGAARRAQGSGRRQGHRKEPAHARASARWAIWRAWTKPFSNSASANGAWRWPANRAGSTPAAGSTRKSARARGRSRSATSTPFREDTADVERIESTLARLCEMVGRRLREHGLHAAHDPTQAALFGFLHHHPGPLARPRDATRYRAIRRGPRVVPPQLEAGRDRAAAGRARIRLGRGRRADGPDGRGAPRKVEGGRWPPPTSCATSSANRRCRWRRACAAKFRERTHENPAGLPGRGADRR